MWKPLAMLAPLALAGLMLAAPHAARADEAGCAALSAPGLFADTTVTSARWMPANPAQRTAAYCEVVGKVRPVPDSNIGVVFRLPEGWNGKLLGLGGGGSAGNVRLQTATPGLQAGYAVLQTDAGHENPNGDYKLWAIHEPGKANLTAKTDFAWRAVHLTAVVGKLVAAKYYGRPHTRAYFNGCSTGGRMGLMEAQRFPGDYDGIAAGAPVYDFVTQTSAMFRTQFFHREAGSNLMPEHAALIAKAVAAQCDKTDGLEDGVVTDPRTCRFNPVVLQCRAGQSGAACLTPKQVATVRNMYAGVKARDGSVAAYPIMPGGEMAWIDRSIGTPEEPKGSNFTGGSAGIQVLLYEDPNYDIDAFTAADVAVARGKPYAKEYEAGNTDLTAFAKRGGKLILWHGFFDPGPSALGTINYYEAARQKLGGKTDNMRLFLAPGVFHCAGGPGADRFDMVAALDEWVDKGKAPETIRATKANSKMSRPLCVYPKLARYRGRGDPDDAASFDCL